MVLAWWIPTVPSGAVLALVLLDARTALLVDVHVGRRGEQLPADGTPVIIRVLPAGLTATIKDTSNTGTYRTYLPVPYLQSGTSVPQNKKMIKKLFSVKPFKLLHW